MADLLLWRLGGNGLLAFMHAFNSKKSNIVSVSLLDVWVAFNVITEQVILAIAVII